MNLDKIIEKVNSQVCSRTYLKVWYQVKTYVYSQKDSQINFRIINQVRDQVWSPVHFQNFDNLKRYFKNNS